MISGVPVAGPYVADGMLWDEVAWIGRIRFPNKFSGACFVGADVFRRGCGRM